MTMIHPYWRRAFVVVAHLVLGVGLAAAATLPAGFTEAVFGTGLSSPTAMQFAPDGRLFVAQQGGALRVIQGGVLLPTPFLSLAVDSGGERGLLGLAFDPNFASNQYLYVYYTVPASPGVTVHNRVSRFTANGNVALGGSELPIIDLENLSATNHNGGAIDFGPDGKLYVAVGDNAVRANSQSLANRLGKILRYNADGSIPADNPFYGTTSGQNRAIWALGLRNPYTFAQNPGGAPAMLINDVGEGAWEEVNPGAAGANYAWPSSEGDFALPSPNPNNLTRPRYAYANDASTCAITGGAFYNPATAMFPTTFQGAYFFADFCGGWIRYIDPTLEQPYPLNPAVATTFASGIGGPVDLKVGGDGALYYLARNQGRVYRVAYDNSNGPTNLAAEVTGSTVRLTWNAMPGASAYRLEAGTMSGSSNLVNTNIGNVTAFEASVPNGTYYVRVRGVVGAGTSLASNQVTVVVPAVTACTTAPPTPCGFSALTGGLVARLSWSLAATATSYVLDVGRSPGVTEASLPVGNITGFETTAPGGDYFARVRAVNACGSSAPSAQVALTLACSAGAVVPTGLVVTRSGGAATFTWQAPLGATGYRLLVGTAPGAANIGDVAVGTATAVSFSLAGVPPAAYYVRVIATSACGAGAASNEVTLAVP